MTKNQIPMTTFRAIIALHKSQTLTNAQIASTLKVSANTVKYVLAEYKQRQRKAICTISSKKKFDTPQLTLTIRKSDLSIHTYPKMPWDLLCTVIERDSIFDRKDILLATITSEQKELPDSYPL